MKIKDIIQLVKDYSRGLDFMGNKIDDTKTRDQVLYGDVEKECTGIVTTCFASVSVIEKAYTLHANLIICHEALFWNHGDRTDWLEQDQNTVYLRKKALLDEYGITVWRDHDYIHSGIPTGNGGWMDGIFKGFLYYTGLEKYYVPQIGNKVKYSNPIYLDVPDLTVREVADMVIKGAGLNGIRTIGNPDSVVRKIMIPIHIMTRGDEQKIEQIDANDVNLLITMEMVDYTVNEYMRDGIALGDAKAILAVGHFNVEEPGMRYMAVWLPKALHDNMPVHFVQSGDMNTFLLKSV